MSLMHDAIVVTLTGVISIGDFLGATRFLRADWRVGASTIGVIAVVVHIVFRCVVNGTHVMSEVACFIKQVCDRMSGKLRIFAAMTGVCHLGWPVQTRILSVSQGRDNEGPSSVPNRF